MGDRKNIVFDAAPSARSIDENGFLHVGASHITKAAVNPYHGREIPGWREAGLNPDAVYYGFRDPEELRKSVPTWAGLPLHIEHHVDSADAPEKLTRVGAVGAAAWNAPYVDAPLTVWDRAAIEAIEDGSFRELSCAYRYDPEFTPGTHEGVAYDFVMRNIRGNHVALVEEGRAGPDVVVADSRLTATQHKGRFMNKLKKWFRGAQDADPDAERKEVELAQAIIDLHKVDPQTGEIVDIAEDEDKAAEIRKIMGEISAKLAPEDVKRLTDALTDLAYAPAVGDSDPDDRDKAMDEDLKAAMDKCGLDAEDPTASQAFAEGVKYGEELEKNPAERAKLDREHEAEGMKKAMDACGLDAENAQESRAFAEGVKYGETLERTPEERKKLDREHEAEGMKKALGKDEDKNAAITRILEAVPDLTPEQRKKLSDSLQDLAYAPATGDEDLTAQDRAPRRNGSRRAGPRPLLASDAALIQARAVAQAQDNMRAIAAAVRDVRPLVGDLDMLGFDSAANVYGYALEQSGVNPHGYARSAWRGMVDMLLRQKSGIPDGRALARDRAPRAFEGPFAGLANISIGE